MPDCSQSCSWPEQRVAVLDTQGAHSKRLNSHGKAIHDAENNIASVQTRVDRCEHAMDKMCSTLTALSEMKTDLAVIKSKVEARGTIWSAVGLQMFGSFLTLVAGMILLRMKGVL